MPRFVRPSFVTLSVDGLKNLIRTGPRRRAGNMQATFFARCLGEVREVLGVEFIASADRQSVRLIVTAQDKGTGDWGVILEKEFQQ